MLRTILLLCLMALATSCAGRRDEGAPAKQCVIAHTAACKGCRVACPAGQTPKCVAGQGSGTECTVPSSCTCEKSAADPM